MSCLINFGVLRQTKLITFNLRLISYSTLFDNKSRRITNTQNSNNKSLFKLTPIYEQQQQRQQLYLIQYRFAGHSKWQNIRHTKAAKDIARGQLFSKLCYSIRKAVQAPGGGDPHLNRELNDVLATCRRVNMPNATIERNIKRGLERKAEPQMIEILGPKNCMLVVDLETMSIKESKSTVKKILRKHPGWGFATDGRKDFVFRTKGLVKVAKLDKDGQEINIEKAEEVAIEAEAEEVFYDENEEVFYFLTDPLDHTKVRSYIENNTNYDVTESGVELIPNVRVELSENEIKQYETIIEQLQEKEEVNRIFDNIL